VRSNHQLQLSCPQHHATPPTPPTPCTPHIKTQSLTQPDKIRHCRELAERGLSDLQAYQSAAARQHDSNISLKGATH